MAEERKYCEDCRWFSQDVSGPRAPGSKASIEFGRCKSPRAPVMDNAYLSRQFENEQFASCMRSLSTNCGPLAQWFEPAPSLQEAAE